MNSFTNLIIISWLISSTFNPLQCYPTPPHANHQSLGAVFHRKFFKDIIQMVFQGVAADAEGLGHLFVGAALADNPQDLQLALA